jgi:subtilisin family serine protease
MEDQNRVQETEQAGCGQIAAIIGLLLWLGLVPIGVTALVEALLAPLVPQWVATALILASGVLLLLVVFGGVLLLTRRRPAWQPTAAMAAGLIAVAGYLTLDGTLRAILPDQPNLVAGLQLVILMPYATLAAWFLPRWAKIPRRSPWAWMGLKPLRLSSLLLALALSAALTLPWALTGALGDSLTSLGIVFQTLAGAIPRTVLLWGLVVGLLRATVSRSGLVGITAFLLYGLAGLGVVFPTADWNALVWLAFFLPLALVLVEFDVFSVGIYPLILLALFYRSAPRLFIDPRDVIASGIPETLHILSYGVVAATAAVLAFGLWGGRLLLRSLREERTPRRGLRLVSAGAAALILWGIWGGLYAFAGKPGFYNDGFLIIMEEEADLSQAATITDREERLRAVRQALIETAERSQAGVRAELNARGVPYRPYYVMNMIRVDGHRWLMGRFEDQPGVAAVILNPNVREYPSRMPLPYGGGSATGGVQPNLAAIHADAAWEMGVTGEGIVVGGQDTGYDWTHPALKPHYRGWNGEQASHDYNWLDAWDDTAVPFDDDSHGTHTMGTVLGDDGGQNRVGVAPGARWIGCRNMRRGLGNPGAYAECMEFFLAPYPIGGDSFADGDVTMAPHLTNNSWGCPEFEGCYDETLEPAVEALRAAGIMMVVSAGNEGPNCNTVGSPPANYDASFSVAATNNQGNVVGFSSRGPVGGMVKPDVSAPGDWVRSSVPGGEYGYAGGTSMAGPHVAGLVALLWSADEALVGDIDATEALICETAVPKPVSQACTVEDEVPEGVLGSLMRNPICACGGVTGVPNNVYGCGFIDAGAAVETALGR